jgi:hypothetical protein
MTPTEVIRQMRSAGELEIPIPPDDLYCWADALDQAMGKPMAYCFTNANRMPVELTGLLSRVKSWLQTKGEQDQRIYTPLFTFPPDAAREIERLTRLVEITRFDAKQHSEALDKIERLNAAITQAADLCDRFDVRTARMVLLDALAKEDK